MPRASRYCLALIVLTASTLPTHAFYWRDWPGSGVTTTMTTTTSTPSVVATPAPAVASAPIVSVAPVVASQPTPTPTPNTPIVDETGGSAGGEEPELEVPEESPSDGHLPEPATIVSGLIGLGAWGAWRRRRTK